MRVRATLLAGVAGALLVWLLDRRDGGARRRHLAHRAQGMVARLRPEQPPENAQTLIDKVRSEVLGRAEWRGRRINVSACDGVVTLNGVLDRPERIDALIAQVRAVTGVRDVESALHLPGTPAPNKVEARTAGAT